MLIPIPPINIQKRIIKECETIDEKFNTVRMDIEDYEAQIQQLFNRLKVAQMGGCNYRINNTLDL